MSSYIRPTASMSMYSTVTVIGSSHTGKGPDVSPSKPPSHSTKPPNNKRLIMICSTVGVPIFLMVLFLIILYCWKKRQSSTNHTRKHSTFSGNPKSSIIDCGSFYESQQTPPPFGYENEALQKSHQDIEVVAAPPLGKRNIIVFEPVDIAPTGVQLGPVHGIAKDLEETTYDISIKLLTPWNKIYTKLESKEYGMMKEYVIGSMEDLYMNYSDFRGSSLQGFRQGSVIADIRLKFTCHAVDPLHIFKKAVRTGKCGKLEVDKKFFEVHNPTGPITRSARIESGYGSQFGSQHFDPSQVAAKLENDPKVREYSQKSTDSIESVTSEIGTSHSVSQKSCSSTNISIQSTEEEAHTLAKKMSSKVLKKTSRKKSRCGSGKDKDGKVGALHLVMFNFSLQDYRELALTHGEIIHVKEVDKKNKGWVKATNNSGKNGWIPQNFIYPVDPEQYAKTKENVKSLMVLNGVIDYIDAGTSKTPTEDARGAFPQEERDAQNTAGKKEDKKKGLFITILPWEPTSDKELKLELGDLVDVRKNHENGWWGGRNLRTHEEGWFPSPYVKPHTSEFDLSEYFDRDELEDKGSVSDSEVHTRASSFTKIKEIQSGYSSDDGVPRVDNEARSKASSGLRSSTRNVCESPMRQLPTPTLTREKSDSHSEYNGQENRLSSSPPQVKIDGVLFTKERSLVDYSGANYGEPPSQPIPPKPRKRHVFNTYNQLVKEGKLGSAENLVTRSTECLVSHGRILSVDSAARNRRNSEELATDDEGIIRRTGFPAKPVERHRPRSFQETPKNSFFYLANRYASSSMKSARSFPTLIGQDQVNLSPDDDRPFLEPIPRRRKSSQLSHVKVSKPEISKIISSNEEIVTEIPNENLVTVIITSNEGTANVTVSNQTASKAPSKPFRSSSSDSLVSKRPQKPVRKSLLEGGEILEPTHEYENVQLLNQLTVSPLNNDVTISATAKPRKPAVAPKPKYLHKNIECDKKPVVPTRSSSKNILTQKFIEEQLMKTKESATSSLRSNEQLVQSRTAHCNGRLRPQHRHFNSFESINEEVEQPSFRKDEEIKIMIEHNHKRYHLEPHDGSFNVFTSRVVRDHYVSENTDRKSERNNIPEVKKADATLSEKTQLQDSSPDHGPPPAPRHSCLRPIYSGAEIASYDSPRQSPLSFSPKPASPISDRLTNSSRPSSMQSLTSIASSSRSTASSKHEQMNLRRAIMDVYGKGPDALSFKVGAILYELRPRDIEGLCYGYLEDSKRGYYPAQAVESFHDI